jgi:hypothetical protein
MNNNAQLDFHPDAESLNAFAERALGDRERAEIVEHLAVCGRCRQVVYLVLEAAVEMEPAMPAAASHAIAPRAPWYRNWRFAWVPVGAMAMVVTLAYVVHIRRVETGAEMAKVTNRAGPEAGRSASQPAASPAQKEAAPRAEAAKEAQSRQRDLKAKTRTEEAAQLALTAPAAAPSPAMVPPPNASALEAGPSPALRAGMNESAGFGSNQAAQAPSGPGGYQTMGALAVQKEAPADAALKKDQQRSAAGQMHGLAARKMERASGDEAAKQAETDRLMAAAEPAASSEQVEVSPAPAIGRGASGALASSRAFAVYKAKAAGLPSGLAAVSTAAAQHSLLAVDKAGNVFLSEDAGSHWESVARQWNGRAVAVRTQAAVKANASGAAASEAGFELVNDQGQVWASADGNTWKIK